MEKAIAEPVPTRADTAFPSRARVIVIGGGIAGVSALYHLARLGWTDALLVEKGQLTSGSTWHAAGLCTQFHSRRAMTKLLMRSLALYDELVDELGHGVGMKRVGSIRLATTEERLDELIARQGMAETLGLPYQLIEPARVAELMPLADVSDVLAAAYLPTDGYVDPTLATNAMAFQARQLGARILVGTTVTALEQDGDGWRVITDRGAVECEVVLNAAGMWASQICEMAGVRVPLVPLQHHYVVTEPLPQVADLVREPPVLRDPEASFYVRAEGQSLLVGPFEPNPVTWATDGVPLDFEGQLLPGDLDRIFPVLLDAAKRVPLLHDAGLKTILNGPDSYTPDGLCLMGEVPRVRNFYILAGFSIFGIVFGGGAGAYAAEWIVDGAPSESMWDVDVRRFGPYATSLGYRVERALETYVREYAIHYEDEELPAGRPMKTDALYDRLSERGAVFGERFGWERPLFFAPTKEAAVDEPSFRLPRWQSQVGLECKAVSEHLGVLDQTSFAKFEVSGSDCALHLEHMCANALPNKTDKMVLTQMLNERGGIECDVTITRLDTDRFYIVSAAAAEEHDEHWLRRHLEHRPNVRIENLTARLGVLTLSGPRAREAVQRLAEEDVSRDSLPFFGSRVATVAGVPARVMRLSYVGELGFEVHHPVEYSARIYSALMEAPEDLRPVDYGYRALDSMRLEKGYRLWGVDILNTDTPAEAGLGSFVDWDHEFLGRHAIEAQRGSPPPFELVTIAVDPAVTTNYPRQYDPVYVGERLIGHVAAGGFGHRVGQGIALGYLPREFVKGEAEIEVGILGERMKAKVSLVPLYDPQDKRLRS